MGELLAYRQPLRHLLFGGISGPAYCAARSLSVPQARLAPTHGHNFNPLEPLPSLPVILRRFYLTWRVFPYCFLGSR